VGLSSESMVSILFPSFSGNKLFWIKQLFIQLDSRPALKSSKNSQWENSI
jgi:hypothetical protein